MSITELPLIAINRNELQSIGFNLINFGHGGYKVNDTVQWFRSLIIYEWVYDINPTTLQPIQHILNGFC